MGEATVIGPGAGELVGDSPERRVEILADGEALHATWSRFGAGREGADLHVHREHTDLFYVLAGELTVRLGIDDRPATVPAGTLARVPPLVVHGFRNASAADVAYLNLHAPGRGFADFMRALRDGRSLAYDQHPPPPDGGRPPSEAAIGERPAEARLGGSIARLLADEQEIAIAELVAEPGAPAPAVHAHAGHLESLFVLEGELVLDPGDDRRRAGAGSWCRLPAGVAHAPRPAGSARARWLELHAPGCGFGAFLRELGAGSDERRASERSGFDLVLAA